MTEYERGYEAGKHDVPENGAIRLMGLSLTVADANKIVEIVRRQNPDCCVTAVDCTIEVDPCEIGSDSLKLGPLQFDGPRDFGRNGPLDFGYTPCASLDEVIDNRLFARN